MKKINLLDTTLREGSYVVDFAFSIEQTEAICRALEDVGVEYIEIGHGMGLNASNKGHGISVASDKEYMLAAQRVLTKSKFGMFCIPGIAQLSDIDEAAACGVRFLRVGTNVTAVTSSKDFIKKAKDYGMFVCANFMKSYAATPQEFAQLASLSESYGADVVYIVDSAGSMFPQDIELYYNEIRKISNVAVGFHGHDNLGFAVANTMKAVELGCTFIDSSLQGLGRSAGNVATEVLIAVLVKLGLSKDFNLMKALEAGKKYVQPLVKRRGFDSLDIIFGLSEFHSSYMPIISKYAKKYNVAEEFLVMESAKIDKVHVEDAVVEKLARSAAQL